MYHKTHCKEIGKSLLNKKTVSGLSVSDIQSMATVICQTEPRIAELVQQNAKRFLGKKQACRVLAGVQAALAQSYNKSSFAEGSFFKNRPWSFANCQGVGTSQLAFANKGPSGCYDYRNYTGPACDTEITAAVTAGNKATLTVANYLDAFIARLLASNFTGSLTIPVAGFHVAVNQPQLTGVPSTLGFSSIATGDQTITVLQNQAQAIPNAAPAPPNTRLAVDGNIRIPAQQGSFAYFYNQQDPQGITYANPSWISIISDPANNFFGALGPEITFDNPGGNDVTLTVTPLTTGSRLNVAVFGYQW